MLRERRKCWVTYVHCPIYLRHWFIVCWELVDLNPVADQLTCDFNFKFGQLALGNGIRFGNDRNDVDLERHREIRSPELCSRWFFQVYNTTYKKNKKCLVSLQDLSANPTISTSIKAKQRGKICPGKAAVLPSWARWPVQYQLNVPTLLSSFFIVTKSKDFSEWPVGAMKYKQAWIRVSW